MGTCPSSELFALNGWNALNHGFLAVLPSRPEFACLSCYLSIAYTAPELRSTLTFLLRRETGREVVSTFREFSKRGSVHTTDQSVG
jgi:hypothetical protein